MMNSRVRCVVAACVLAAVAVFADDAAKPAEPAGKTLKVLMIGNSFSMQMVKSMPPIAKDLGLRLDICSMYIGGCPLERHWKNISSTNAPYGVTRSIDGKRQETFKGNIPSNYLQALVWTAKLFGVDVTKCTYAPPGMDPERAAFLRRIAMKAVGK